MSNKRITAVAFAAPFALGVGTTAMAQFTPVTLQLGVGYNTNGDVRRFINNNNLGVGLLFGLPLINNIPGGHPFVGVNFTTTNGRGGHLNTWGLEGGIAFDLGQPGTSPGGIKPYAGFALGVYHHDVKVTTGGGSGGGGGGGLVANPAGRGLSQSSATSSSASETRFGGKLFIGAWLTQKVSLEASYRFSGNVRGTSTDVVGLMLGVRF